MTPPFSVHTTPHFDRSLKKLIKRHPNLGDRYAEAIEILNIDPQNLSRTHNIRKLGSGSFCERSFTSFRMTSLASVILSGAKNLNSCRALARKSQTDPLPTSALNCVSRAVLLTSGALATETDRIPGAVLP